MGAFFFSVSLLPSVSQSLPEFSPRESFKTVRVRSVFGVTHVKLLSSTEETVQVTGKTDRDDENKEESCPREAGGNRLTPMHISGWPSDGQLFSCPVKWCVCKLSSEFDLLCGLGKRILITGSTISEMCCLKSIIVLCLSQENGNWGYFIVCKCFNGAYIMRVKWRIGVCININELSTWQTLHFFIVFL